MGLGLRDESGLTVDIESAGVGRWYSCNLGRGLARIE